MCSIQMKVLFLVLLGNLVAVEANEIPIGPHFSGYNNPYQDDDVPVIKDLSRRRRESNSWKSDRSSRNSRGRRSSRRRKQEEESDVEDYDIPSFSLFGDEDEYDDMCYERERIRRRRNRKKTRHNRPEQSKLFGLGAQFDLLRTWTEAKTGVRLPRINIECDPVTILKVRKAWSLPGVIFRIGADFETYRLNGGFWKFRACCEDKLIGGRFVIKEVKRYDGGCDDLLVEYSKSWIFDGVGAATRFNLRAAYDLNTKRGGVRFGIRTENVGTIGRVISSPFPSNNHNFSVIPVLKLDAEDRLKAEVKTNIFVPNPELVLGMDLEGQNSVGIGGEGIHIEVEELNLIASF